MTGYAGLTFAYSDAGRMKSVTSGSGATSYTVSALGQRVKKAGPGGTRLFIYDEAGHLLGEYDSTGALIHETVWMGDTPVATLRPNGGAISLFYVHSDHLNTPRRASRPSDSVTVWRWDSDPFGSSAANEDPDGDSTLFVYNLRFPGQYYDAESGLSYNYFRDSDSATGRYVESDPIGLNGGINTYAYVRSRPVSRIDPRGLFDKSICEYYRDVSSQHGCRYHSAAYRICRGDWWYPYNVAVYGALYVCSLGGWAQPDGGGYALWPDGSRLDCIRRCLIASDRAARERPECRAGDCGGPRCITTSCIDAYHRSCFAQCGVAPACYGGNWGSWSCPDDN